MEKIEQRVSEGERIKPFYRLVCYDANREESIYLPIGLHILGKFYYWLKYRRGNIHKSLRLITYTEWEKQYLDGYNEALQEYGDSPVSVVIE